MKYSTGANMSFAKIALVMGLSQSTVIKIYYEALKKLKDKQCLADMK